MNFRPAFLTLLVAVIYAVAVLSGEGGWLSLVTLGSDFVPEANPALTFSEEGYDGQFVYFIARDPAAAAGFIAAGGDVPAYRYQRILLPALGFVASLGGQDDLVPAALLIINLAALTLSMIVLENLLSAYGVSRWYALGYGLSVAGVGAVRLSLTEPLAYGLAIGALWYCHRQRWPLAAVLLALAALAKETTLVFAAAVVLYLLVTRRYRSAGGVALIAGLPFALWQLVLYAQFGAFGVGSGGRLATSFEVIPLMGVIRILTEGSPTIFLVLGLLLLPFALVPAVWGLWRGWQDLRQSHVSLLGFVLTLQALVMLFVPFSTYREPLGILRFIAGLQIGVILYAAENRQRRPLRYSVLWALTLLLVLNSDLAA